MFFSTDKKNPLRIFLHLADAIFEIPVEFEPKKQLPGVINNEKSVLHAPLYQKPKSGRCEEDMIVLEYSTPSKH